MTIRPRPAVPRAWGSADGCTKSGQWRGAAVEGVGSQDQDQLQWRAVQTVAGEPSFQVPPPPPLPHDNGRTCAASPLAPSATGISAHPDLLELPLRRHRTPLSLDPPPAVLLGTGERAGTVPDDLKVHSLIPVAKGHVSVAGPSPFAPKTPASRSG
jgi:hypothetical protein